MNDSHSLELVPLDRIRPMEDAAGNRLNSRDLGSFDAKRHVEALAEQFAANRLNPGQPHMPPILYKSNDEYLIVDGECRVAAVRLCGVAEAVWADVYDDADAAEEARIEAAKAVIETNVKLELTEKERSVSVQRMLDLDIPDAEVACAARIDEQAAAAARRGHRARKKAAAKENLTLEHLAALAEFEGDDDAVRRLAASSNYLCEAKAIRDERRVRARLDACLAHMGDLPELEEVPDASRGVDFVLKNKKVALDVKAWMQSHGDEALGWTFSTGYGSSMVTIYVEDEGPAAADASFVKARSEAEAAEREAERKRLALFREAWEEVQGHRDEWVGAHVGRASSMGATAKLLRKKVDGLAELEGFRERTGARVVVAPDPVVLALGYMKLPAPGPWPVAYFVDDLHYEHLSFDPAEQAALIEAMRADGYEPLECELEFLEQARAFEAEAKAA